MPRRATTTTGPVPGAEAAGGLIAQQLQLSAGGERGQPRTETWGAFWDRRPSQEVLGK